MIQQQVQKLMQKDMNRRQFLAHLGAGALTVIGVTGLMKHLVDFNDGGKRHLPAGYGSSAYGGKKK